MSDIYHWSNDDADFILFNGYQQTNPGAVGFNGNLIKNCIEINSVNGECHRAQLLDKCWGGIARDNLRWQFAHTTGGVGPNSFASMSGKFLVLSNVADGRDLFRIANLSTNSAPGGSTLDCQLQYWSGSAWIGVGAAQPCPVTYSVHTITVKIHDTLGVLQWHMNGALMATLIGDTKFTSSTQIDTVAHWCWGKTGTGPVRNTFAEHMLADYDFPTYGLHITNPYITGIGSNSTQASGDYTKVNEKVTDTGTAMAFTADGQTFTGEMENIDASLANTAIMGVRLSALARPGVTGPQNIRFALQQSGGLDVSVPYNPLGIGYGPIAHPFFFNPQTGNPFTPAEINAPIFEPGVQAET